MSQNPPPASIVHTIERASPGFWRAWNGAVSGAFRASGGFHVTSWWRSGAFNREVGGSDFSQHLVGVALDVLPRTARVATALRAAGFRVIDEGDHLHAQPWPAGSARSLIRFLGL